MQYVVKLDGAAVGSYSTKAEAERALRLERYTSPAKDHDRYTMDEHEYYERIGG